jgi:hypothetical protein
MKEGERGGREREKKKQRERKRDLLLSIQAKFRPI